MEKLIGFMHVMLVLAMPVLAFGFFYLLHRLFQEYQYWTAKRNSIPPYILYAQEEYKNLTSAQSFSNGADFSVNPANGLPMVNGINSVDVMGNPYGVDSSTQHTVNPANGLPMVSGINSVDVMGNPYGVDSSTQYISSGSDNFSCGGGSSFGGGFGSGSHD